MVLLKTVCSRETGNAEASHIFPIKKTKPKPMVYCGEQEVGSSLRVGIQNLASTERYLTLPNLSLWPNQPGDILPTVKDSQGGLTHWRVCLAEETWPPSLYPQDSQ